MKAFRIATAIAFSFALGAPHAWPQSITGKISGTVLDPAGALVPGAKVELVNDLDHQERSFSTQANGAFLFADLVPGNYTLKISMTGFKSYQQNTINVSAEEKVALHDIKLEVGNASSSVTVQTDTAHIATDSSDRSILVDTKQIENTPIRGRDFMGLIEALPGVVDLNLHDSRGYNAGMPTVNGGQAEKLNVSLDGVPSVDPGNATFSGTISPSVDAIAEVRVLVSNFSAEYTSHSGGQMSVTIKNGTNQFHGSAYYFYRHEGLDANEFFNNQAGTARPIYRYTNPGGTIGGPLFIPGTRLKNRNKLFFFFSEDYLQYKTPVALSKQTMPTALERTGDFSQTLTTTGKLIPILNPSTGAPYPGNVIPASMISAQGAAVMSLFPLPNAVDPTGQRQYNYLAQFVLKDKQEDRILRVDYNISTKTQAFIRLIQDYQSQDGSAGNIHGVTSTWGQLETFYGIPSASALGTIIHTFTPSLVNEATVGINRTHEQSAATAANLATNQLAALKGPNGQTVSLPSSYPGIAVDNLIPNISFATLNPQAAGQTITNAPTWAYNTSFPATYIYQYVSVLDNLSWVKNNHYLKFGFYLERQARNNGLPFTYGTMGTYYFGSDTASPYDTGYPFSNLLLGSVQAYGQDNSRPYNHSHQTVPEFYAQDSWKATRRVTLELGVRFSYPGAVAFHDSGTLGLFNDADYKASSAGQLLFPAVVNGKNVSINRVTGAVYPLARQSFFDPLSYGSSGNPYSGIVQTTKFAYTNPGWAIGPRVGFAWDVFGDGKTALRGGFGIYYARELITDSAQAPLTAPPAYQSPLHYDTTFAQLQTAEGFLSPQTVYAGSHYKNSPTYTWSFGFQRNLGKGFILDAAYVGNVTHNKFVVIDGNGVAPYTTWTPAGGANPAYLDPTTGGKAFITANLIRPYQGYGTINGTCSCGESNYHSLQTQVNRRFGKRLIVATNWTWSKTMAYTRGPWTPDYLQYAEVPGDRPQVVNISYSYQIPDGSRFWKNPFTVAALDGWHFNGITKLMDGNPLTVACTASGAPIGYWTGTPTGGIPFRCQMGSPNPFLSTTSGRSLYYPLNAANFSLPAATSLGIGNTPPTLFLGPGLENFDFTLFKDFRLSKEKPRTLEIRGEFYNVFNHFDPGNPNTSLTLNYSTGANTNAAFGNITTALLPARHIALAAKFRF